MAAIALAASSAAYAQSSGAKDVKKPATPVEQSQAGGASTGASAESGTATTGAGFGVAVAAIAAGAVAVVSHGGGSSTTHH